MSIVQKDTKAGSAGDMLYFDSLSKKSTPNLSRKNSPSSSPKNEGRSISKSPCSTRGGSRSPCSARGGSPCCKSSSAEGGTKNTTDIHLDPNSTLHQKYALGPENGKAGFEPHINLADMDEKALEEYLGTFQPALLGSLAQGKLTSLGLREGVDEDVSVFSFVNQNVFI